MPAEIGNEGRSMTTISDERLDKLIDACLDLAGPEDDGVSTFWGEALVAFRELQSLRAQGGVRVKPLEWNDDGTARSSLGDLYDVASLGGSVWQVRWNGTAFTGWHSSREDARAAAQADYEHRILSAIEASPAPVSEYAATRDDLFEAASDQSLSDAAVRQLCLAKLGPITSEVREWASAALAAKGGQ